MNHFAQIFIVLLLASNFAFGQSGEEANNKIKGIYVYQFAKNVDWPKEYKSGDFIIGVFGERTLYNQLVSSYAGKSIGSQPIKIKFFSSSTDISKCHILYIANENSAKTSQLAKKFVPEKTLIVSNNSGSLMSGSIINFMVKDSKIAFEINTKNAKKSNLIIGQTLTKLAANVM